MIASDTVGFIHKLPHQLVEAFQATLEEVTRADALLEVVDLSDAHAAEHRRTVQRVLDELGAGHKPRVVVLNKVDLVQGEGAADLEAREGDIPPEVSRAILGRADRYAVKVSALAGDGLGELKEALSTVVAELWVEIDVLLPYSAGDVLARVRERGTVQFEYRDEEVRLHGRIPPALAGAVEAEAGSWQRVKRGREPRG